MLNSEVLSTVIQLGAIFAIFYLLLLRPQQVKIKQHEAMLNAIKVGDKIITGGGVYAKVVKIAEGDITVEIAKDIQMIISRATIRDVLTDKKIADVKAGVKKKNK